MHNHCNCNKTERKMNSRNCLDFINFQAKILKKNNRPKNPALLVSAQFADSKPENKTKKNKNEIKIYSIIYTEFLFFSLCWVVNKEKNYFTIRKLSIYTVKRIWVESQKCSRWKSKEKAQFTVLCRNLKLMSRHELVYCS